MGPLNRLFDRNMSSQSHFRQEDNFDVKKINSCLFRVGMVNVLIPSISQLQLLYQFFAKTMAILLTYRISRFVMLASIS